MRVKRFESPNRRGHLNWGRPRPSLGCGARAGLWTCLPGCIRNRGGSWRPANEPTKTTATLIEVNGWRVLPILLVPAALTGLALVTILKTNAGQTRRRVFVWAPAVLLLGFCILGSFSIGIFYLPSALALVLSSILVSRSRRGAIRMWGH